MLRRPKRAQKGPLIFAPSRGQMKYRYASAGAFVPCEKAALGSRASATGSNAALLSFMMRPPFWSTSRSCGIETCPGFIHWCMACRRTGHPDHARGRLSQGHALKRKCHAEAVRRIAHVGVVVI